MATTNSIVIPGNWNFDYNYFAGETASRFFDEIKDNAAWIGAFALNRMTSLGMPVSVKI